MRRRNFIRSIGALTGGLIIGTRPVRPLTRDDLKIVSVLPDKEQTLWDIVSEQFLFPDDYTYLNTGGIGAVPTPVLNTVANAMNKAQLYPKPGHDMDKWNGIKENCTHLLGSECKKEELALISCATEGINIIINGFPFKEGDEVITSAHEHPAVHIPLLNKMQTAGIKIRIFEPDTENGFGNVKRIEKLISNRTKLIILSHVTCTTGQIFPIKEISELAKSKGIKLAVDGAQAPGSMPLDVNDMGADFYTFSCHKWTLGPKRTGILYVREDLLDFLRPTTVGAYSDDGYDMEKRELKFHPTARRYEFGTVNESLYQGLEKASEFVKLLGLGRIKYHNKQLAEDFYSSLMEMEGIKVLSPKEKQYRSSMITFKYHDKDFRKAANYFSEKKIRVRVVPEAKLDAIRVSFHVYNDKKDLETILTEIKNYLKK